MQALRIKLRLLTTLFVILFSLNAHAGDLDDDIKMDDGLDKYDSISQPSTNISYIKRSAKASATGNSTLIKGGGDTAIGGFINKPGAKVGDVTIIFDGEDINAISE
jgi:hypothetical protein